MLEDILLQHFDLYPQMEPQDAVKLIYQQEFGPGHLIKDEKKAMEYLRQELAGAGEPLAGEALYDPIGNGLCRLNLRVCKAKGIPAEDILRLFVDTARHVQGDKKKMTAGIRVLQKLAEEDETPFEAIRLDLFLAKYPKTCPAVHHSDAYRTAYHPAYRVVSQRNLRTYLRLLRDALQSLEK
ncbi:MAG: hypothetical protein IK099_04145 [Clostridia bacterium]|nr:hypothetical protein [Clostridia bacterium]